MNKNKFSYSFSNHFPKLSLGNRSMKELKDELHLEGGVHLNSTNKHLNTSTNKQFNK